MATQTSTMPTQSSSQPIEKKKPTTKAERREQQEQQRANKAAQKSAKPTPGSSSKAPAQSQKKPETAKPTHKARSASISTKDVPAVSKVSRGLQIFSHFNQPKLVGQGVKGDIHPVIARLSLQFSEFKICGSNARCIAVLTAFKTVIQDYTTPPNNTLSRHLMTYLSPQISYLVTARPMSVTMGNAIRQLKLDISASDIDLPEQDAKDALCQTIDNYIRDRIIVADEVISELAGKKIKDGDVVLTYARSSLVEKILLNAHEEGKRFSVIVVDSRPLLEGKRLLASLTSANPPIPCTYGLLGALPTLIGEATTVLIGAHSLHSNGSVYSRAGTALVSMMAKESSVPVMACCETYKFSENIMLDGFGTNELAPQGVSQTPLPRVPNLQILDPLFDLTPPSSITAVVTEVGLVPPSSISSIPSALGRTIL